MKIGTFEQTVGDLGRILEKRKKGLTFHVYRDLTLYDTSTNRKRSGQWEKKKNHFANLCHSLIQCGVVGEQVQFFFGMNCGLSSIHSQITFL